MATYFISDLHLHHSRPEVTELFFQFLIKEAKAADALYILGDFFEVWIGDESLDKHDTAVLSALSDFSKTGVPVYFMHGNRDFLIKEQFVKRTGCVLIEDPFLVEIYNKRLLLAHGDTLCTQDLSYQRFRRVVRSPLFKWLFLRIPFSLRKKIAGNVRTKSMEKKNTLMENTLTENNELENKKIMYELFNDAFKEPTHPEAYFDVSNDEVQNLLRKYNSYTLIHGHTHKPGIHTFELENQPAQRIVLGEWKPNESFILKLEPNRMQLFDFAAINEKHLYKSEKQLT